MSVYTLTQEGDTSGASLDVDESEYSRNPEFWNDQLQRQIEHNAVRDGRASYIPRAGGLPPLLFLVNG